MDCVGIFLGWCPQPKTRLPKPTKLRSMGLSKYDHIFEVLSKHKKHGESFRFFGNLCGIPKTLSWQSRHFTTSDFELPILEKNFPIPKSGVFFLHPTLHPGQLRDGTQYHEGLVEMIFLRKWVILGSMLIFRGYIKLYQLKTVLYIFFI